MSETTTEPYRPTIRCSRKYEQYIDHLQKVSDLDRNQIIRLAMFVAPFSGLFRSTIEKHLKDGVMDCPTPPWGPLENILWQTQNGR